MSYFPAVGDRVKLDPNVFSATHAVILEGIDDDGDFFVELEDGPDSGRAVYIGADKVHRADMPAGIFDHEDSVGDSLTVYTATDPATAQGEPVAVTVNADTEEEDERTVLLTREAVARLRAALRPYDDTDPEHPFDNLTQADAHELGDPDAYVVTKESFPLDARRVAAMKLAAELAGKNVFGQAQLQTTVAYAAFLLGELSDYTAPQAAA
ncbi:hypothetical protein [Micromonospora sp. NPDC023956]|uniref:hypothetical protein n=1 Tax=Micromonospora sp. NPDC023956 TaxID=3155722 RepID=UPI0033E994CE